MSYVFALPDVISAAATDLANIGSTLSAANTAAVFPTTNVLAAGADEVSAAAAAVFGAHALNYQALSAQATAFHRQFVQALQAGTAAYAGAEAVNAAATANPWQIFQQNLLNAINAPFEAALQRPLIGNGSDALPGSGKNGGAGGLLWGDGGNGGSGTPSTATQGGGPGGNGGAAGLFGH
ncbi:PE family protein, partial [Mycobacterium szulgai]